MDPGYLSEPEVVEFPTEQGLTAFMNFYPPKNKASEGPFWALLGPFRSCPLVCLGVAAQQPTERPQSASASGAPWGGQSVAASE